MPVWGPHCAFAGMVLTRCLSEPLALLPNKYLKILLKSYFKLSKATAEYLSVHVFLGNTFRGVVFWGTQLQGCFLCEKNLPALLPEL